MKTSVWGATAGFFLLASAVALAHDHADHERGAGLADVAGVRQIAQQVVPEAERKAARNKLLAGAPEKTAGIAALRKLGRVALDGEFDDVAGRVLRTREIVFEPGAAVALHRHEGRPGVAYIIEGEITEYRIDADGNATSIVKKAGDVALENTGIEHYWKNESGQTVRALVVDIIPAE